MIYRIIYYLGLDFLVCEVENGGLLTVAAEVFDADGYQDIASVEILIDQKPTGIKLRPLGTVWSIGIMMEPGLYGSFLIELQAIDRVGNKSDIWPYITFHKSE